MFKLLTIITLSSIISTKGMVNKFKPLSYKNNEDSKCETGIKISSPSDKKLILTNGGGSIKVKDFISGGDFEEGAGTIEFENVSGEIKTKIGAGNIKGITSSDNVSITSSSGKIDLKWNKILDKLN